MKSILLTTTAIVAFAGAAYADGHASVGFGGDAELGYNDEFEAGIFWSLGLTMNAEAALDNGLTAGATLDIDITPNGEDDADAAADTFEGFDLRGSDYVLSLTSETAGLYYGDTNTAAAEHWFGVTNMDADSFMDGGDAGDAGADAIIRGEGTVGAVTAALSYVVDDANGGADDDIIALSAAAVADLGTFSFGAAYQDEDAVNGEIFGLSGTTTFSGVEVTGSYANETVGDVESIGVEVTYTVSDAVEATVFYVAQSAGGDSDALDDNYGIQGSYEAGAFEVSARYHDGNDEEAAIEGSYDVTDTLSLYAGYIDEMENGAGLQQGEIAYIAGKYDMGGGAELLVSYADVTPGVGGVDSDLDDLGAEGLREGTTVLVSFSF